MIWTLDQIMSITRLRVELNVSRVVLKDSYLDAFEYAGKNLFSRLKEAAQPWAVDLDILNVELIIETRVDSIEQTFKITALWHPMK